MTTPLGPIRGKRILGEQLPAFGAENVRLRDAGGGISGANRPRRPKMGAAPPQPGPDIGDTPGKWKRTERFR
jgi:hypothetical protein